VNKLSAYWSISLHWHRVDTFFTLLEVGSHPSVHDIWTACCRGSVRSRKYGLLCRRRRVSTASYAAHQYKLRIPLTVKLPTQWINWLLIGPPQRSRPDSCLSVRTFDKSVGKFYD